MEPVVIEGLMITLAAVIGQTVKQAGSPTRPGEVSVSSQRFGRRPNGSSASRRVLQNQGFGTESVKFAGRCSLTAGLPSQAGLSIPACKPVAAAAVIFCPHSQIDLGQGAGFNLVHPAASEGATSDRQCKQTAVTP